MRKYKIVVAYDGTAYSGWQFQENAIGIQQVVEEVLAYLDGAPVRVYGSSRTDAGVHAKGFVAHFFLTKPIPATALARAMNARLPEAIRVLKAAYAREDFDARLSAKGKEYRYQLYSAEILPPHLVPYWAFTHRALDLAAMRRAASYFVGRHDFVSFAANPNRVLDSTERTIFSFDVKKAGPRYTFIVRGDGFLYKQVRSMVGFLVAVGKGREKPEAVRELLTAKAPRTARVETAPSRGLFLWKVFYRAGSLLAALALLCVAHPAFADAGWDCNFGADLRIRQEIMQHVPGLPGDGSSGAGVLSSSRRGNYKNHVRFRPRVWGEVRGETADKAKWRFYTRLTDEFRWYVNPRGPEPYSWPDEVILDNLFIEAKDLFDGFFDFVIGRQDLYGLYDLDHIFVDGTPGDGSRTTYTDMVRFGFNFENERRLDVFGLYNFDDNVLRWGTERGKHRSNTGLGGGAEVDMDDWGFGAIWSDRLSPRVPYKVFLMQKNTAEYIRTDASGNKVQHPWTQRELLGAKVVPQIDEEWSLQFEGMGQVGVNGEGATLSGWSTYAGGQWKSARKGYKPFAKFGYHFMSGDDDAGTEDGGHSAWDPMWARGVNDSELFLYGTHYGAAWWSNMHYVKVTTGIDFGPRFRLTGSTGPLFAAAQDGLGGGRGYFKGLLSQLRLDIPFILADKSKGERFELFGHLLAEFFNPGDYYATDKPAWFVRWQVDFTF